VKLAKPICLFAGKNFSGKSSLQEAVRMALTGESVRVSLKKDYGRLSPTGQTVGYASSSTTASSQPSRCQTAPTSTPGTIACQPSCPTSWTHSDFQACRPMIGARSCLA
jgi:hypothetical protein